MRNNFKLFTVGSIFIWPYLSITLEGILEKKYLGLILVNLQFPF